MDETLDSETPNQALIGHAHYIREERALDLIGHLHCDVFNQDKFLINGVEVRISSYARKIRFALWRLNQHQKYAF